MRITQQKVAEKLGLSRQAIAFAVSDSPDAHRQLHPDTRRRILEAARQMGYVPNNAARRLARTRSNTRGSSLDQVGVIFLGPAANLDMGSLAMMGGAEQELSKLDATLTFVRIAEEHDWNKVDRLARSDSVDGWLVIGQVDDAFAARLKTLPQPFVILADSCCTTPVPHVDIDNFAVGRMVAQHLASLGHRRVAYILPSLHYAYQRSILDGFRAGVKEWGLDPSEELFGPILTWERRDWIAMLEWLFKLDPVPSAIFTPETAGTTELRRMAQGSRVRIPHVVSLIGLDFACPACVNQGITRISLPILEIGIKGVHLLHRLISGDSGGSEGSGAGIENIELKLPPVLIEEGTTAPPGVSAGVRAR